MKSDFLLSVFPYIAIGILVVGTVVRCFLDRGRMEQVAGQVKDALEVFASGTAWRISLVLLFVAHLLGLIFPRAILSWNSSDARLYLLEGVSLVVGLIAVASLVSIIWRSLGRSARSAGIEVGDTIFLALLLAGVVSGVLMAILNRWGSSWGAMTLTPYAVSLLRGQPVTELVIGLPFLARLHVISSFAALAAVPGTRLSAVLVLMVGRAASLAARPLAALGRSGEAWLQKHNLAGRIWPEED